MAEWINLKFGVRRMFVCTYVCKLCARSFPFCREAAEARVKREKEISRPTRLDREIDCDV